ncbi:MAG: CHAD domain-containing protein [Solirubrobacterales bacterium]|nr:CHAD domain-containing protein [Solirubrobacterales bacterium]
MSYGFGADESVRTAVVRCAREQLDRAVGELSEGINEDPIRAVHDARKAIKKERSLLRLARGAMPPRQRRRENAALRDAARELSGTRDADVIIATLDSLSGRFAGQLPAATFDAIREQLKAGADTDGGRRPGPAPDGRAVKELEAVRMRVNDWKLSGGGWRAIEEGLVLSYKRGREAFARARRGGSMEDLHEWRKRVKDLWHHQRLLAPVGGPGVQGEAKDAHRLSDLLGDDHDLALLRQELTRGKMAVPVDLDAVVELIDHQVPSFSARQSRSASASTPIRQRLFGAECGGPGTVAARWPGPLTKPNPPHWPQRLGSRSPTESARGVREPDLRSFAA